MSPTFEHYVKEVMSGRAGGPAAAALRAAMAIGELPYAAATRARNRMFDAGLRTAARLPRPVISVGNITSGGTGKTPVVRWLAERLRASGRAVAILSRGYKAAPGSLGDEQHMLAGLLNVAGEPPVIIRSNPSRHLAGRQVLGEHPETDAFLLDDGFQHRALARDFDLVLVNAAEPFGYGRVLPRGLLREPLSGLSRASAFLLTRVDQVSDTRLQEVRRVLQQHNAAAPVYDSVHAHVGFRTEGAGELGMEALRGRRWFAFCGIGEPESFVRQLESAGGRPVGRRFFPDHWAYTESDVQSLQSQAKTVAADVLVTTEKDWVKLSPLAAARAGDSLPVWRADVQIRFKADGGERLLGEITSVLARHSTRA